MQRLFYGCGFACYAKSPKGNVNFVSFVGSDVHTQREKVPSNFFFTENEKKKDPFFSNKPLVLKKIITR